MKKFDFLETEYHLEKKYLGFTGKGSFTYSGKIKSFSTVVKVNPDWKDCFITIQAQKDNEDIALIDLLKRNEVLKETNITINDNSSFTISYIIPTFISSNKKRFDEIIEATISILKKNFYNPNVILTEEKEEERVLSTASPVSTQNYKVSYIEINSIDTNSNGKLTKSTKMDISFGVELEVKNPEIELENVKVYLVTPGKREKLIIDSKVPKERTVRSENEGLFEAWITNVGMKSNIKNFDNEKIDNHIRWNGTSGIMGSVSFKDLIKTPAEKNEMDKKSFFEKIKSLVSPGNQYSYLFKFVIKAKDKEEELIYQPAIFNVKLMGAKKI